LHKAVVNKDKTVVDLLLETRLSCGESTLNLNLIDEDNMTPLAIAIKEENQDIASKLLD
jgi:ankyrin repeat protein